MVRETEFFDVVADIYAAAHDGKLWPSALTSLSDLIGGVDATLEVHSGVGAAPSFFAAGDRLPRLGIQDYLGHYAPICPRIPYQASLETCSIGCDYDFISERQMNRDAFYEDFLRPEGLRYFTSGVLFNDSGDLGGIFVHRSPLQGHSDTADRKIMKRLVPHIAQSLKLHLKLESQYKRETHLLAMLDRLHQAVLALDSQGRIMFANDAAAAILTLGDGLSQSEGQLVCARATANKGLVSILKEFARDDPNAWITAHSVVMADRPSGRAPYVIALHRIGGIRSLYEDDSVPSAFAFIYDPDRSAEPHVPALQKAFSLTKREIDLALGLANGRTLQEQADARGVKISTERSHLKTLMRKTDTNSQAELVRMLTKFVSAIPAPRD